MAATATSNHIMLTSRIILPNNKIIIRTDTVLVFHTLRENSSIYRPRIWCSRRKTATADSGKVCSSRIDSRHLSRTSVEDVQLQWVAIFCGLAIDIILNTPDGYGLSAGLNSHYAPTTRLIHVLERNRATGISVLNRPFIEIIDYPATNIDDPSINYLSINIVIRVIVQPLIRLDRT